ncbi:iron-containing alcohol dehydrogenase [bacterium]|nr:iron-containing alcohol dehydrogenase [bacterium]
MKNFKITQDGTEIYLGDGETKRMGELVKKYKGKKVLLVYGKESIKKNGLYEKIVFQLKENSIEHFDLSGVKPNPILEKVEEGIEICKRERIDFILAVGGGSVIDSAKAIAGGALDSGSVWDYYQQLRAPKEALPLGVVLTIPATGSESNPYTVLSYKDEKRGTGSPHFIPKFAILDPENTLTLPSNQTAFGVVDMFLHICEQYFHNEYTPIQDGISEGLLRGVIEIGKGLLQSPNDKNLRAASLWAGNIALSGFLAKGVNGGDWSSHSIEHEISAINDIAHGAGLAVIFPAWLEYVSKKNPKKIEQFGKYVFEMDSIESTIKAVRDFFESLSVSTFITDNSIKISDFDKIATQATKFGDIGGYVKLKKDDIKEILKIAIK